MIGITWWQVIECLSFHASYGCAHSGGCCRTGWDIPFTNEERDAVEHLQLVSTPFVSGPEPGVSLAGRRADGACIFLDADAHRCMVHRAAGQQVLPLTCRMFPRVVRHDPIGTRLSLSHYCPTAAGLLFTEDAGVRISGAPLPLMDVGHLDGLDARSALPPLLRPDLLMDVESYRLWESRGVEILTASGTSPQQAIDELGAMTQQIVAWAPGAEPLIDVVTEAADRGRASDHTDHALATDHAPHRLAADRGESSPLAVKRWLAARLFANWIAYQGRGLETIVRYLQACYDAFTIELARDGDALEAIRRADYLIVHETDSQELAGLLS